ncbi:uncharacterized protein LOC143680674 [Tamandua tetradactyla]|uniref:uncharacterized protein LOC143680674 n=1 Tax=Tamandua tetradactyla TaxID=48850 RepID=UPI0040545803
MQTVTNRHDQRHKERGGVAQDQGNTATPRVPKARSPRRRPVPPFVTNRPPAPGPRQTFLRFRAPADAPTPPRAPADPPRRPRGYGSLARARCLLSITDVDPPSPLSPSPGPPRSFAHLLWRAGGGGGREGQSADSSGRRASVGTERAEAATVDSAWRPPMVEKLEQMVTIALPHTCAAVTPPQETQVWVCSRRWALASELPAQKQNSPSLPFWGLHDHLPQILSLTASPGPSSSFLSTHRLASLRHSCGHLTTQGSKQVQTLMLATNFCFSLSF